jgi:hypothetical protein
MRPIKVRCVLLKNEFTLLRLCVILATGGSSTPSTERSVFKMLGGEVIGSLHGFSSPPAFVLPGLKEDEFFFLILCLLVNTTKVEAYGWKSSEVTSLLAKILASIKVGAARRGAR